MVWYSSWMYRLLRKVLELTRCRTSLRNWTPVSRPDDSSSGVERWRLRLESVQQTIKQGDKKTWIELSLTHVWTYSAHECNPTPGYSISPHGRDKKSGTIDIKRTTPIFEGIVVFLQCQWPTSKFCTFSGIWCKIGKGIWIRINDYGNTKTPSAEFIESPNHCICLFSMAAHDNWDPVNLELAKDIGLSVPFSFHCIRQAPTAYLEASTCTPNGSP